VSDRIRGNFVKRRSYRLIAVLVTSAISSFGLVALAPPASADTPGCVTRGEYRHVHRDYTKPRVHRVFDTNGEFWDGHAGGYTRIYQVCDLYRRTYYVTVTFTDGPRRPARLFEKGWFRTEG